MVTRRTLSPTSDNPVEIESQNPYYLSFFGLAVARAEKKWNEATHLCETALQLKGKEPQFHLNLAEVYVAAGRRASAIATLERAIENFGPTARLPRASQQNRKAPDAGAAVPEARPRAEQKPGQAAPPRSEAQRVIN